MRVLFRAGVLAGLALAGAMAGAISAQAPGWRVSSGEVVVTCPLTVGGSFEARTHSLAGQLAPDAAQSGRLTGELSVDLNTLDTGIGLRNTHLREKYLETGRGDGFDRAVLSDVALRVADVSTFAGTTTFTGSLLVHGIRKPVLGDARVTRAGGEVRVEARFPVSVPDFGVPKPRYLGVGVRDQVQVRVTFTARSAGAATGSTR